MTVALGAVWQAIPGVAAPASGIALPWPATADERLVWLTLTLVWTLGSYYVRTDPPPRSAAEDARDEGARNEAMRTARNLIRLRSLTVTAATVLLLGLGPARIAVAVALGAISWGLAARRAHLVRRRSRRLAEWEIGTNAVVIGGLGIATALLAIRPAAWWIRIDAPAQRIAVVAGIFTALALMGRPATYVVRGILSRVDLLPRVAAWPVRVALPTESAVGTSPPVDVREYNRGLVIGNLERLVVLTLVALSQFAALGFLIAAKGLIRSKEFESRNFAEYFLVGTLSSVVVALAAGLIVRAMVYAWW